jgi:hypothetical protein
VRKPTAWLRPTGENEGCGRDGSWNDGKLRIIQWDGRERPEIYTVDDMRPISKARQQK